MLQALLMACEPGSPYRNISDRTVGVVFLGVPHRGYNKVGWALAALYKLVGYGADLLNLKKGSPELDKLHDRFLSSYKAIDCICFYECEPEYMFGISIGPVFHPDFTVLLSGSKWPSILQVVDKHSATIAGNNYNIGLEADHRGINKFKSIADLNYIKVLEKLKMLVNSAPYTLKRGNCPPLSVAS
jgi:hypothetical protein